MPWITPTLKNVRTMVRDYIRGSLPGADASTPNSVLRVMSDTQAGLAHLNLQFLDWLALQLLPDTAETEWLDRHATIWLSNAPEGSRGRKAATLATGVVTATGTVGIIIPEGSTLVSSAVEGTQQTYETLEQIVIGVAATPVHVRALDPGVAGNMDSGEAISFSPLLVGVDREAIVYGGLGGGTDVETDDELRFRVLQRIQQPPMGGDKTDFEAWVLQVPGVTRAWCSPLEQGIGTVTTRFMMDDLRKNNDGIPLAEDVLAVETYLSTRRPVAVKDVFVVAPLRFPLDMHINKLVTDTPSTRQAIEDSLRAMLFEKAIPGETIYRSWVEVAIADAIGVDHFELVFETTPMPSPGHLALLGSVIYAG